MKYTMEYNFSTVEKKWQNYWREHKSYKTTIDPSRPKFYVLDMFPYPSGAGLHVGHPLGYIASDIFSRYKRSKGFNVLHPMGYDAFGLPAEQYAIQTGQHPSVTTEQNIKRYREQLDNIGFSFDWDREVRTCDPKYYKWTQYIFLQLFNSWYNKDTNKAEAIDTLIGKFRDTGNVQVSAAHSDERYFSAEEWINFSEKEQKEILLNYRLAFLSETTVNWCPVLGTVLANEEVKEGVSERGGYPVERKLMKQWSLRISAYAQRLLDDLKIINWSESIEEHQRNWIGRSEGAEVSFKIADSDLTLDIFTTRPDTIFGATFMAIAPEHELIESITNKECYNEVTGYIVASKNRSERERMSEVKNITGVFTGSYAIHPFSGEKIQIWVADYVLAGYGTGAVMAVPAHDSRDYAFAKHFNIPIKEVVSGGDISKESYDAKEGTIINSDFLNGLSVKEAVKAAIKALEEKSIGKGKINYRLRDAIFGRQRYWGEPIPIYYKDGVAYPVEEKDLPILLPPVDKYLPTEDGEPPLARAKDFTYKGFPLETTTMPGWAGSSWYFLRYMDASNEKEFVSKEAVNYWKQVDLYVGGAEHASGHLLYVRFWTQFLFDRGFIPMREPAKVLLNQGMIQGRSNFVYRVKNTNTFVSANLKNEYETTALHVDVNIVENDVLDIEAFKVWLEEFKNSEFILEDGKYICGNEVEKMSKSKWNVISPDLMIEKYGADCLRLYEMFLGPVELSKPWNTNGISGTANFIRKLWKLFHKIGYDKELHFQVSDDAASKEELKVLHKTIKKVEEDIERFSFNTSVSTFMICVNDLTDLKCNKRSILEPLTVLISSYAPHIAEELWSLLGNATSVTQVRFPEFNPEYLVETEFAYPISVNGKTKLNLSLSLSLAKEEIEREVLNAEEVKKVLSGQPIKKIIVVPGRIVNIVI